MCYPTGDYAYAHTMYTTYVTVTGNSQQAAVMKVFYDAQQNNITLPDVFQQVHGGTTVSTSQQQGKDVDRSKRVTAGFAELKGKVNALKASSSTSKPQKKVTKSKPYISEAQKAQHQQNKVQNKAQSELNKKINFLLDKRQKNPNGLTKQEVQLLQANGH